MAKEIKTEADVRKLVKKFVQDLGGFRFAPVSNGMGVHGIPDDICCIPVEITQEMVGQKVGLFVGIESKKPGRRKEENRGASANQMMRIFEIRKAYGLAGVCDGKEDLEILMGELAHHIKVVNESNK